MSQHDYLAEAAHRWPDATVFGDGRFALLSCCVFRHGRQVFGVILRETIEDAERAKTTLDCVSRFQARRCDGAQSHVIVDLSKEPEVDLERDAEVM